MTIEQQMTEVLFSTETLKMVKNQFKIGKEIISFDQHDMTLRLKKAIKGNINLEALTIMNVDNKKENIVVNGKVIGYKEQLVKFWKPIGFYQELKKNFFQNIIEITILNEFKPYFDQLKKINKIKDIAEPKVLTLKENAVIAGFSKETRLEAAKNKDIFSFKANGLDLDIYMTNVGYPEVFLDDKYGLGEAIVQYRLYDNPPSINPITTYKNIFDTLREMDLLTAHSKDA